MERETRHFNLLDWLILTILVAAIALFGFFLLHRQQTAKPSVGIECVLRLPASEEETVVQIGDVVRNENGTLRFGEVIAVSEQPYKKFYLQNERLVYGTVQDMIEIEITVRMTATRGDDYRVGDIRVSAGEVGNYRIGSSFVAGVTVVSMREVQE